MVDPGTARLAEYPANGADHAGARIAEQRLVTVTSANVRTWRGTFEVGEGGSLNANPGGDVTPRS